MTVIETPPMVVVGLVGYIETPRGLRALSTVWAQKLDKDTLRRFYKNWMNAKKKAFSKYADRFKEDDKSKRSIKRDLERIQKYCCTVRVLCATQVDKLNLRQVKSHIMEIQVNGGEAWLHDIDLSVRNKVWTIKPSPDPEMSMKVENQVELAVMQQMEASLAEGVQLVSRLSVNWTA